MKKILGFILAAAAAASSCLPVYAQEQSAVQRETITVSLSAIPSIVMEYNLDVKKAANDLQSSKDLYEGSAKEKPDKDDYQIAWNTYETTVQTTKDTAVQNYLAYCSDSMQLSADQTASDIAQKQLSAYLDQMNRGYLAQKDYNSYLESSQAAKNTLQAQDAKVVQEKKSLRTALNIPETSDMDIKPVANNEIDLSGISKINYTADLYAMQGHDLTIDSASLGYAAAKDSYYTTDADKDTAKIKLEQAENSETAAFKNLYDTLVNSYQSYQQEQQQTERKQAEAAAEKQKLALGYTSQKSYDSLACDLQNLQCKLVSDRNTLYINFLKYNRMKDGYVETGSSNS